jgi:hypothetical protein
MSTWLLLAVVSVAGAGGSQGASTASAADFKLRSYHQYEDAIDDALRTEARAKDEHQRAEAIRRLAALFRELRRDPRLETSDTLKGYKTKVWSRLTRVKADLQRQVDREAKLAKREGNESETKAIQQATESLAEQMSAMNYTMGGPGYVLAQTGAAFGGGAVADNGQELIDLIQHTIRPDYWDTVGGPGSIFYFRPLMALVVRASSEVHGNVGGLVDQLRRAGN